MEPFAPDWHTLGAPAAGPTAPVAGTAPTVAPRTVAVTPRLVAWMVGGVIAAALTGGAVFLALMPGTGSVVLESGTVDLAAAAGTVSAASDPFVDSAGVETPVDLVVDVEGAVAHPGLVHVAAGSRVGDALAKAGGFAPGVDLTRTAQELNLAAIVTDGLKVVVPVIGQGGPAAADAVAGSSDGESAGARTPGQLDLNRATETELDTLPGVGPATIAKIVAARQASPFSTIDELRSRGVVGEAVFQKLKGLITVGR